MVGGPGGLGGAICRDRARLGPCLRRLSERRSGEAAAARVAAALGDKASPLRCDLSDAQGVRRAVDDAAARPGGLGAVIFAGGVPIGQPFVSTIEEPAWREVFETELIGFTRVVGAAIPHLRAAGGGAFVAVSSFANVHFPPGDALSSVPKAAIESLCRAVAKEEGRSNIRATAVGPGIIDAGLGAEFLRVMYNPEIWDGQRRPVPLRSSGSADEVAEAVAFLASGRARYITGQTLIVDGGLSL